MVSNRNHEGYYDYTACEAIRKTYKASKHKNEVRPLSYPMREAKGYSEARGELLRKK